MGSSYNRYRQVCAWIGSGEGCRHPTIVGKSYCEVHQNRMYIAMLPEMATYILDKESEIGSKSIDYQI